MFSLKPFRYFDYVSLLLTLGLLCLGLFFVYSATFTPENPYSIFFKKQLLGIILGLVIYFVCSMVEIKTIITLGYYGFFATTALLCYTIIGGKIGMGGQRWISLGFIRFQPSELAKITLPFFFAVYISEHYLTQSSKKTAPPLRVFFVPLVTMLAISLLVMKQPDLGTALLIIGIGLIMLWITGLPAKYFIVGSVALLLAAPILWKGLKPYQQKRILSLFGQGSAQNERYQIEQSKIAIGSGGLKGKGFLKGTQNKLAFLPEDHTDFIFSVICEELGFLGGCLTILMFWLLFLQLFYLVATLQSLQESIIAVGLMSSILISVIINIGMVVDLLPTVGIPLPLLSYGLTHVWVNLASLGILQNLSWRRFWY